VVGDFLKEKKIPVSAANWDELFNQRILPALEEEKISIDDLRNLLRNTEECGRQHVFLYQADPTRAQAMMNPQRIQPIVTHMGLSNLMHTPLDLELPNAPQIVDIRGEKYSNGSSSLVIKRVETRSTKKLIGEKPGSAPNTVEKIYSLEKKRAVSLAKLHSDGLLEIRIARQDNSSQYQENIGIFFNAIAPILPRSEFKEISLSNAKSKLISAQETLKGEVRFVQSEARNATGNRMSVSTASLTEDIFDDDGSKGGLNHFLGSGGKIDRSNFYIIVPDPDAPREIHVLLSGEVNEFAIPASCTATDYDHVCGKIREFNK
jgi:hypothetical protein